MPDDSTQPDASAAPPAPPAAPAPAKSSAKKGPAQPQRLDETVKGGRYINADGVTVNANGEPID